MIGFIVGWICQWDAIQKAYLLNPVVMVIPKANTF
jgi:hypothetical protein